MLNVSSTGKVYTSAAIEPALVVMNILHRSESLDFVYRPVTDVLDESAPRLTSGRVRPKRYMYLQDEVFGDDSDLFHRPIVRVTGSFPTARRFQLYGPKDRYNIMFVYRLNQKWGWWDLCGVCVKNRYCFIPPWTDNVIKEIVSYAKR